MYTVVPCSGWCAVGGHRPNGVSHEAGKGSRGDVCGHWRVGSADPGDQGALLGSVYAHTSAVMHTLVECVVN